MERIFEGQFNYDILKGYKKICVACSGGMDSVTLLQILSDYRQVERFELYAVNIDHDLRETSKSDSSFVKKLCKDLKITLFYKKVKVKAISKKKKIGIEECAREERYNFFNQLVEDKVVDVILLAHHNRDDVETMLSNLARGCFLNGLYGIKEKRGHFLRPMLKVPKDDIIAYVEEKNLQYVEDETNEETKYKRNYIRKEILPKFNERFPTFEKNFISLKKSIASDEKHFEKYVNQVLTLYDNKVTIKISKIEKDEAVAYRAYIKALKHMNVIKDIYKANLDEIHGLLKKENGKHVSVKEGVCCFRDYEYLTFQKNETYFYEEFPIEENEYIIEDKVLKIEKVESFDNEFMATYVDADKLIEGSILRRRKVGDIFHRKVGTKKLKSYLIDRKIPQRQRDDLFVVGKGKDIYAIIGVECSVDLMITEQTENIYKITYKKRKIKPKGDDHV